MYQLISNIHLNSEKNEAKGLSINQIKDYIESIFPNNFPINIIKDIISKVVKIIKHIEYDKNEIKYMFEINNINKKYSFYLVIGLKINCKYCKFGL